MRFAIIGMGVAGMAAAESIRKESPLAEILFIGDDPNGFYSRPGLAYFLTGELNAEHLFPYSAEPLKKLNAKFKRGVVTKIFSNEHEIELNDSERIKYDRLLLATGASALKINTKGADLEGVVKLDHIDDAKRILKLTRKTRAAVVVGGGITALEIVEGLVARRVKVHYFLRGDRYWSNVLDETESRIVEERLKEEGVQIHYNTELDEVIGKKGRVSAVKTKDGKIIKCEMLAAAVGIAPRIQLAQEAGITCDKGILVNEFLETNIQDIYAAGDVAQIYDPGAKKYVLDSLWGPAREQGAIAGFNMAGKREAYKKSSPFNVTRLAGLTTTIIGTVGSGRDEDITGIARGDSETWRELPNALGAQSGFDVNHLRLVIGEKTILGAILMGDQTLSHPIQDMVSKQIDVSAIRPQLLKPNAQLGDILAEFWKSTRQPYAA